MQVACMGPTKETGWLSGILFPHERLPKRLVNKGNMIQDAKKPIAFDGGPIASSTPNTFSIEHIQKLW